MNEMVILKKEHSTIKQTGRMLAIHIRIFQHNLPRIPHIFSSTLEAFYALFIELFFRICFEPIAHKCENAVLRTPF